MAKKKQPRRNLFQSDSHGGGSSTSTSPPPRDPTANPLAAPIEAVHRPVAVTSPAEADPLEALQQRHPATPQFPRGFAAHVPAYYTSDHRFNGQINVLFARLREADDDSTSRAIMGEIDRMINPEPSNWTDSLDETYPEDGQLVAGLALGLGVEGCASSASSGGNGRREVRSSRQPAVRIPMIASSPVLSSGDVGHEWSAPVFRNRMPEVRIRRQPSIPIPIISPPMRNRVWGGRLADVQGRQLADTGPIVPHGRDVPPTPPARPVEPMLGGIVRQQEDEYFIPPTSRARGVRPTGAAIVAPVPDHTIIRHARPSRASQRVYLPLNGLNNPVPADTTPAPVAPAQVAPPPPLPPPAPWPPSPLQPPPPARAALPQHELNKLAEEASLLLELYTHPAAEHTAPAAAALIASAFQSVSTLHRLHGAGDFILDAACIVCFAAFADTLLLPCAHLVLCSVSFDDAACGMVLICVGVL